MAGLAAFGDVDDVVDVVDRGVDDDVGSTVVLGVDDDVVGDSARRPTPLGDPEEQAAANPMPTTRIAVTRSDPARRTARTVPGDVGPVDASGQLDDS